jgi:hypothetical protein
MGKNRNDCKVFVEENLKNINNFDLGVDRVLTLNLDLKEIRLVGV